MNGFRVTNPITGQAETVPDPRTRTPRGDAYYARNPAGHVVELPLSAPLKDGFELVGGPGPSTQEPDPAPALIDVGESTPDSNAPPHGDAEHH